MGDVLTVCFKLEVDLVTRFIFLVLMNSFLYEALDAMDCPNLSRAVDTRMASTLRAIEIIVKWFERARIDNYGRPWCPST